MENILLKIEENCPFIEVVAGCRTGEQAIEMIQELNPQLVFMDIQLGTMSGFDVLERLPDVNFEVIFTTGFDQYAVQAFKVSALDYLLKPIDDSELIMAVKKAYKKVKQQRGRKPCIAVPVKSSIRFLAYNEIMYCRADDQRTVIYIDASGGPLTVGRVLSDIESKLPAEHFFRIHRGAVINWEFVKSFERYSGGFVTMKDGRKLSVAKSRKEDFLEWLLESTDI